MGLNTNEKLAIVVAVPVVALAVGCGTSAPRVSQPARGTGTAPPSTSPASPSPSPKQAQVGDKFTIEPNGSTKYDVTLLSVNQNATPASEYEAAPAGDHLAAAQFRVQAITKVDENANNNASATGSNEQAYTSSLVSVSHGTNFADGQIRLSPGGSLVGWVTFTLPAGVNVAKVQWTPQSGFSSQTAEWAVNSTGTPAPSPTAASPAPTAAPSPSADPADTVRAYFAAINSRDYAEAWRLGGRHVESSYSRFVSGFATTSSVAVEILSVSGNVVTARVDTLETDGTTKRFQGDYTVNGGVITAFRVRQVS